jgi:hypothetical protein
MKSNNIFIILLVSALILSIFIIVEYYENHQKIITIENNITSSKPEILFQFVDWAKNTFNSEQYIFRGYIYNFGDIQANNIIIKCAVYSSTNEKLISVENNIGNIASTSYKYIETLMDANYPNNLNLTGYCYIIYSDNAFNLAEKMPEFKKYYD